MSPYLYLPIHPALKELVVLIGVMRIDFSSSLISSVYRFPWMNNTHLFFPLKEDPLWVKSGEESTFHSYSSAYFVGPKLVNDTVDFGRERHVVGITFKPGAFQRLMAIPGKEVMNIDIDATYIFGNGLKETEMRLKDAAGNEEILAIVEDFLFKKIKQMSHETPFDNAINELLRNNGNLTVETFANYACKSIRQLERQSIEKLGMSPRLFARLIRFGRAFSTKEMRPDLNWTNIAYHTGYYDQMHLIKDFKTFIGTTPKELNLSSASSVKMMAALHGIY